MRLSGAELGVLLEEMDESFDADAMDRLLRVSLGKKLRSIAGGNKAGEALMLDVFDHFNSRNTVEELVAVLASARPSVPVFARLAQKMGFVETPSQAALEVLIRPGTPYMEIDDFQVGFARCGAAVCRVRVGNAYGTGTLISEDIVLTNHHVVAGAIAADGSLKPGVVCQFDYRRASDGHVILGTSVKASALLAHSPHADEDVIANGVNQDPDRLDYALLKLEMPMASAPRVAGGDPRGHIDISGARAPRKEEGILMIQHPDAEPMKVDLGSVTWTGATRLRHNVNSRGGSSGAPIFDAGLQLIAIHHAGHEWPGAQLPYNQGIPLQMIVDHARAKSAAI